MRSLLAEVASVIGSEVMRTTLDSQQQNVRLCLISPGQGSNGAALGGCHSICGSSESLNVRHCSVCADVLKAVELNEGWRIAG